MTAEEYIEFIAPIASSAVKPRGFFVCVVVAQSLIESTRGTSELAVNANNYLGRKGHSGDYYYKMTPEYHKDIDATVQEPHGFQKYDSPYDCFVDYCDQLSKPWYTLDFSSPLAFLESICPTDGRPRYASDKDYVEKIWGVIQKYNLLRFD